MSLSKGEKYVAGITGALVLVIVLSLVWPGPANAAAALVIRAPANEPIVGDRYATLRGDRELWEHEDRSSTAATWTNGTRMKVVQSYPWTAMGMRLFRVFKMAPAPNATTLDTGPNTRGYILLSQLELDPITAAAAAS